MKRLLAALVFVGVLGLGIAQAAPPSNGELQQRLDDYRADEAALAADRERLDDEVIRPLLRPLIRDLLIPCTQATTLAQARSCAQHALDELARPGPADSVSKTIHTETRQFGSRAARTLRRHIADVQDDLAP